MKRIITIILLLCVVFVANASEERQTQINNIKKSREYLYSDVTMGSQDVAVSQAFEQIQQEIMEWAASRAKNKSGNNISPLDINQQIDTILLRRANMYRVFAYVRKDKLLSLFSDWNLVLKDDLDSDKGNELVSLSEEEKIPEVPQKQEEPASAPTAPPSAKQPKDTVANKEIRTLLKNHFVVRKGSPVIEQILTAKNFFELKGIMEPLKQKGAITAYGKYATAQKPEECYLIVYDPAGNIRAVLDKGEKTRLNLKTGKDDSIRNYRGCGAIWFKIKD